MGSESDWRLRTRDDTNRKISKCMKENSVQIQSTARLTGDARYQRRPSGDLATTA